MKKSILLFLIFCLSASAFAQSVTTYTASVQTAQKQTVLQKVEKWYADNMGYGAITALMAVESSFIPFPSEIVVPPAAYIASQPDSKLNIFLIVLFATLGALIGALINYYLAVYLGRVLVYKFAAGKLGHFLLLSPEKIAKAEVYFNKKGNISTFIGRLIPGIRQLISIPAGLAKMNMANFLLYTFLGAGIWNSVLALLGYIAHGQQDLIEKYSHELSFIILGLLAIAVAYFIVKWWLKKVKNKQ